MTHSTFVLSYYPIQEVIPIAFFGDTDKALQPDPNAGDDELGFIFPVVFGQPLRILLHKVFITGTGHFSLRYT